MQIFTPTLVSELIYALAQENSVCVINQTFNLNDQSGHPMTVYIASGVIIKFEGGLIKNGLLFGNQSGIATSLEVEGCNHVFENVILDGWWQGNCSDLFFKYEAFKYNGAGQITDEHDSFYPIWLNLLAFEKVELHRDCYFFDWPDVLTYRTINEGDHPFHLDGHNATFYIAKNKGNAYNYDWGMIREYSTIFELGYGRREVSIKNLNIIDNNDLSPYADYGEENCDQPEEFSHGQLVPGTEQINYFIFSGIATRCEFLNVRYNGGGCFHSVSNNSLFLESLKYSDCDLYSKGFVLEVANTVGTESSGRLERIIIDHCTLHSHANRYAGSLSFIGNGGVGQMLIRNSKICGYRGNLEFFGVKTLLVDNCTLVNQGPSSEFTNGMPILVKYTNCHFFFTEDYVDHAYVAAGENLYFSNNIFQISHRLVFSNADRLFLLNNTVFVPSSNLDYIFVVNDSVKIGYYHNNAVSCPNIYENHVSLRLDNPYVLAMYSPFQIAFCAEKELCCDTFNPWNSFQEMSDQGLITTDADGYARTTNESVVIPSPAPKNNTVSVTLTGKMFSVDGVHPIVSFIVSSITPNSGTLQTEITVEQSYGWMYLVYVNHSPLAYISVNGFNGFQEDVRLDITATAVNGVFEIFVFVNNQLFAKGRYADSSGLTAGSLTITPNPSTGIRSFRYVSGGFIADEPDEFINASVLN